MNRKFLPVKQQKMWGCSGGWTNNWNEKCFGPRVVNKDVNCFFKAVIILNRWMELFQVFCFRLCNIDRVNTQCKATEPFSLLIPSFLPGFTQDPAWRITNGQIQRNKKPDSEKYEHNQLQTLHDFRPLWKRNTCQCWKQAQAVSFANKHQRTTEMELGVQSIPGLTERWLCSGTATGKRSKWKGISSWRESVLLKIVFAIFGTWFRQPGTEQQFGWQGILCFSEEIQQSSSQMYLNTPQVLLCCLQDKTLQDSFQNRMKQLQ